MSISIALSSLLLTLNRHFLFQMKWMAFMVTRSNFELDQKLFFPLLVANIIQQINKEVRLSNNFLSREVNSKENRSSRVF